MTPARWQQVKEIFNSAIKHRPDERDLFLAKACASDQQLRDEVESLIASHEKSGTFIDDPAYKGLAPLIFEEEPTLQSGALVGSYEIVSFISHGGMGEVYL